jgi:membrane protein implicated in regulation of membrane protease activity
MILWQLFLSVGLLLIAAEIFVPGFVLLPIGISFVLTAGVAYFTNNVAALLIVLAVSQGILFFVFKKFLKRFQANTNALTNAEGMVGKEVEVIETVSKHGTGYVKLYGDRWLAQCDLGETLEKGRRAVIVAVSGNRVTIEPISED